MGEGAPVGRGSRVAGRGDQQLRVWQGAHALSLAVFKTTEVLRKDHRWFADQFVRSAVSVAANIAEGYNRGSLREYIQFLNIARGSLSETEYYVIFGQDSGLLATSLAEELGKLVDGTGSLLLGLIRSLKAKDNGGSTRMIREASGSYDAEPVEVGSPTPDPRPTTQPEAP